MVTKTRGGTQIVLGKGRRQHDRRSSGEKGDSRAALDVFPLFLEEKHYRTSVCTCRTRLGRLHEAPAGQVIDNQRVRAGLSAAPSCLTALALGVR